MADNPQPENAGAPEHGLPCPQEPRLIALERTMAAIQGDVHAIRAALLGEMGGRVGICSRLAEIEEHSSALWRKVDSLAMSIHGNGEPGINERLRNMEKIQERNARLSWVLVAAIVAQVAMAARQYLMGG